MGVFNAAANQVLISPVTEYYRGKAIRQDQADKEQMSELRGLQIKQAKQELADAPSKREAARQAALLQAENIQSQIAARYATEERADLKAADEVLKPLFEMYSAEKDEDVALANFNRDIPEAISRLSPKQQKAIIEGAGEDHQYSHEEVMLSGLARRTYQDLEAGEASEEKIVKINEGDEEVTYSQRIGPDGSAVRTEIARGPRWKPTEAEARQTAKEAEIAEYEAMGRTHEDAVKLAYDKITVKENTKTGMMIYTDTTTVPPTVTEIPVDGVPPVIPEPRQGRTLFDLSEFATGPVNAAIRGVSIPAAWAGMSIGTKQVSAKQTFQTTTQDFIRGMALSEKYAVGEQDRIREDIAILPSLLDDPILMRTRMISMDEDLELRQITAENDASNTQLNPDIRQEAASAANRIKNFRAVLGVPPRPKTIEEAKELGSGAVFIDPYGEVRTVP